MPKYRPILSLPAGLLFLALLLTLPARSQVLPPIWNFRPSDFGTFVQTQGPFGLSFGSRKLRCYGYFFGSTVPDFTESAMEVDYIRVYQ